MQTLRNFVSDERGQDLVEYALLSGIIGTAGMLVFPEILDKMAAAYVNWQTGTNAVWEPCAPSPAPCG